MTRKLGSSTPGVPYRAVPPAEAERIRWPDSFGTRFLLMVDTEEEFDWSAPFSRTAHATRAIHALPAGHRRLVDGGAAPAYMVDFPVMADPAAAGVIRDLLDGDRRAGLGAQLHAWVTPPFDEPLDARHSFAGNLPAALEAAKLDTLTRAIETATGRRPRAYRAGRYGIGPNSYALLAERGYRLDSSVRAHYDYSQGDGPDFQAVGSAAYRIATGGIVEVPFTTVFTGIGRRGGHRAYGLFGKLPHGRGAAARLGLLSRISLTPEDMPLEDVLEAIRIALDNGLRLFNFAFHSPSLVAGNTPYVRDAADLAGFHRWWDAVLALLARKGVAAASLDEVIAAADAGASC